VNLFHKESLMRIQNIQKNTRNIRQIGLCAMALAMTTPSWVHAATDSEPPTVIKTAATLQANKPPVASLPAHTSGSVQVRAPVHLMAGKSMVMPLSEKAVRISIANPDVADVMLVNPKEVYLLGKKTGTTNLFVWSAGGATSLRDVTVGVDTQALQSKLREWLPAAENLQVDSVADTLVLRGHVHDALKAQRIVHLAEAFSGGKKAINMMRIDGAQQVMLEVKVAEVSKTLLDELGVDMNLTRSIGNTSVTLLSQLLTAGSTTISTSRPNGQTNLTLTAEMKKGLVKVLAEPTITAVNGQEGSFLAGGRIYIPVPQSSATGAASITLEEKEFGVGLKFLPTVLEDGLINLRVTPEVSELSQYGTTIKSLNGQSSLLPSITTRRASTTVQLRDGESFAIGGLIKSNVTESIKALPILGELPVLGALFRSNAFQKELSELLFVVTPRLVKPSALPLALPTDNFKQPTRAEFFIEGQLEGRGQP
jgi:pilus assembly protein CpaC